ncbi:MAG: hypothetical protein RLZZ396_2470, partial [Planctomycetota bacterium]
MNSRKVIHISHADIEGGAARAAYRIHRSFCSREAATVFQSELLVNKKSSDDESVKLLPKGSLTIRELPQYLLQVTRARLIYRRLKKFKTTNPSWHSICATPSNRATKINAAEADVVNLHWLGDSVFSIEEIGRLTKPLVWTLHDQWAFCGAEHYTNLPPEEDDRYAEGYLAANQPSSESGYDVNRQVWLRKKRSWRKPMHIVCPSRWLADCARRSALMQSWPISIIPYPIDITLWAPAHKPAVRREFQLDDEKLYLVFGAIGGTSDPRKGGQLLCELLHKLNWMLTDEENKKVELLVFGEEEPVGASPFPFRCHYFGNVGDDRKLAAIYSAADIMLLSSRLDNLPNTALEAHACGIPVVGFDVGGVSDIIDEGKTGFLAKAFDTSGFASKVKSLLSDRNLLNSFGVNAR